MNIKVGNNTAILEVDLEELRTLDHILGIVIGLFPGDEFEYSGDRTLWAMEKRIFRAYEKLDKKIT